MTWTWNDDEASAVCLAERVERWGKRLAPLGVAHFDIACVSVVEETPGGPGAKATMRASTDYDRVEFWFRSSFLETCSAEELDQTIIHEWMHVAMRDLDFALQAVERWMPEATYEDFEAVIDHEREGLVDRLANAFYLAYKRKPARFSP